MTAFQDFQRTADDSAFHTVVQEHSGLVFGTALRMTKDKELAQEISQNVFISLSQKANTIKESQALPAWLYRATVNESKTSIRADIRYRARLEKLKQNHTVDSNFESEEWQDARALLDETISTLPKSEQRLLLLHYYEKKTFRQIGEIAQATEAACQKRVSRILNKLQQTFARKGVTITSAVIATCLSREICHAAPQGLSKAISAQILTNGLKTGHLSSPLSTAGGSNSPLASILMTLKSSPLLLILFIGVISALAFTFLLGPDVSTGKSDLSRSNHTLSTRSIGNANNLRGAEGREGRYAKLQEAFEQFPEPQISGEILRIMVRLSTSQEQLLDCLAHLKTSSDHDEARKEVFEKLAQLNQALAFEKLTLIAGPNREFAVGGYILGSLPNHIAQSLALLGEIETSSLKKKVIGPLALVIARTDFKKGWELADSIPKEQAYGRTQVFASLIALKSESDAPAALALTRLIQESSDDQESIVIETVSELAKISPDRALAHAKLIDGEQGLVAQARTIPAISQQDLPRALAMLKTTLGKIEVSEMVRVIQTTAKSDPASAIAMLDQLQRAKPEGFPFIAFVFPEIYAHNSSETMRLFATYKNAEEKKMLLYQIEDLPELTPEDQLILNEELILVSGKQAQNEYPSYHRSGNLLTIEEEFAKINQEAYNASSRYRDLAQAFMRSDLLKGLEVIRQADQTVELDVTFDFEPSTETRSLLEIWLKESL